MLLTLWGVEIEAHTSSKSIKESLLLVLDKTLVLIDDESELDDLLSLKFVLHKRPIGYSTIWRNGVEVQLLDSFINIPPDLPNWISVLVGSHSGEVHWPVVAFDSDVVHHNGTIVKTNCKKCWVKWMEVQTHDSRLSWKTVLWECWIFNGVAADQTCGLL